MAVVTVQKGEEEERGMGNKKTICMIEESDINIAMW